MVMGVSSSLSCNTRLLTHWLGILLHSRPSVRMTSSVAGPKAFTTQWFKGSGLGVGHKAVKQVPQKQSRKNRRLWLCCRFPRAVSWSIGRVKWHLAIRWQIPMLPWQWVEVGLLDYSVPSLILTKGTHRWKGKFISFKLSPNCLYFS